MKQYIATVDLAMYLDMANFMGWCDDQTSSSHPCPLAFVRTRHERGARSARKNQQL